MQRHSLSFVQHAIETAQRDASTDRAYQFLAKRNGIIVGRLNLTGVIEAEHTLAKGDSHCAETQNARSPDVISSMICFISGYGGWNGVGFCGLPHSIVYENTFAFLASTT